MTHLFFFLKRFARSLHRGRLDKILAMLVIILIVGTLGITYFEPPISPLDAAWWTIVTITTVGYGDITPATLGGRAVGALLMFFGIGFLGMFTATLASMFIESRVQEAKGMKPVKVTQHFLICGWNYKAREILEELRADKKTQHCPIVIIAELKEKPVEDDNLHFVNGVVTRETLEKANSREAQVAIVLADEKVDFHARDARTILDTLTIKTTSPHLYVCVELVDHKNVDHCKMAKADEIIVTGELSTNLLVQAALDHGVTQIITELVSNRFGSIIFKLPAPREFIGKPFLEVFTRLKTERDLTALAVECQEEGRFLANPQNSYIIQAADQLVVIGKERPL